MKKPKKTGLEGKSPQMGRLNLVCKGGVGFAVFALLVTQAVAQNQGYVVTDLGTLSGSYSHIDAINNLSQVADSADIEPGVNARRYAEPRSVVRAAASLATLPLDFEVNQGQADAGARFVARGAGYAVYLEENSTSLLATGSPKSETRSVWMRLLHAQKAHPEGIEPGAGISNYLIGNAPEHWHTKVRHFGKVLYRSVYPGIDLIYYGNQKRLEHDFVVGAGADPRRIALAINGADAMSVTESGDLQLKLGKSSMFLQRPVAYQELDGKKQPVDCAYSLDLHNRVRFIVGNYNRRRALVIDPTLVYSTYLGGSNNDQGNAIAVDNNGNAYVTGFTLSSDFPVQGPLQATCANSCHAFDVFVTKFNPSGGALIYSTFLGGSGDDDGYGIAVDPNGNAYITGYTNSTNFPTKNPAQAALGGGVYDAFVAALNADGSALIYSTYLGGSGSEGFGTGNGFSEGPDNIPRAAAIAVDSSGNAYVTGNTDSADFPILGASQATSGGKIDGYLVKYDPTGTKVFATYLGGSDDDVPRGIALDGATPPNIYVTGNTRSANFPSTSGAYQRTCGTDGNCNTSGGISRSDAFVTKFNSNGAVVYSTYLGGGSADRGTGIAVDSTGAAYIAGTTGSRDFPVLGPFQSTCKGCSSFLYDSFVAKLNSAGSALVFSTYLGGNGDTEAQGISIDSNAQASIAGFTTAPDFPTLNAIQAAGGGGVFSISSSGAVAPSNSGLGISIVSQLLSDSSGVYAATNNTFGPHGLFKSTDGGATWAQVTTAPSGIQTIALDPSNPGTVYGNTRFPNAVNKSTDGGASWTTSTTGLPTSFFNLASLAVDPSNPSKIFFGTSSGVYVSTDGAATWAFSSTGLPTNGYNAINSIIVDPTTPTIVYASLFTQFGTSPGIFKSTDGGASWTAANTGLTFTTVNSLAMDPSNSSVLYAGTPSKFGGAAGVFKTTNGAASWSEILDSANNSDITALGVDGSSNTYAGLSGGGRRSGLLQSTDGGIHWVDIGLDGASVTAILPGSTTLAGTSDSTTGYNITGNPDAFVTQLNAAGNGLGYSTYLGGTNYDQANAIAVDSTGKAYITGYTDPDFPTTGGAYDTQGHHASTPITTSLPPDSGRQNDIFVALLAALGAADLAITKTMTPAQNVAVGDPVTITLVVTNNGPDPAITPVVTDPVPQSQLFVPRSAVITSTPPACMQVGVVDADDIVGVVLRNTAPNTSCQISFVATAVSPSSPATNTASVKSITVDPNPDNNSSTASIAIAQPLAPVVLPLSIDGGTMKIGDMQAFNITFTNADPMLNLHPMTIMPDMDCTNGPNVCTVSNDMCSGTAVAPAASCSFQANLMCTSPGTVSGSIMETDNSTPGATNIPVTFACTNLVYCYAPDDQPGGKPGCDGSYTLDSPMLRAECAAKGADYRARLAAATGPVGACFAP